MSVKFIPHVSKWAQALVPLADRVLIKELVEEIGGYYSIAASSPRGPLLIQVTRPFKAGTATVIDMRGEPDVILPKAIAALRAWVAVNDGALDEGVG